MRRTPSEADRRTVFVALTPEGLSLFDGLAAEHEAEVDRLFADLSEDDLDHLTRILKRMGRSDEPADRHADGRAPAPALLLEDDGPRRHDPPR